MKTTTHKIYTGNSNNLSSIPDKSVHLIVTSPPYPMIEMWDKSFALQDSEISSAIEQKDYLLAFEKMHRVLDAVWRECDRVLVDNGFVCINIGDATRTFDGNFQLFSNHSRIIQSFLAMGYCVLPDVLWHKPSNSPNKFMGSGMYPAGAYVTYEHEYILVFRKGGKRVFKGAGRELRQKSAYFWEERNIWFSDIWEIRGTNQAVDGDASSRKRNASFPLEIPYRLVNMYSVEGDTVLDPFAGMGTTNLACMASGRNSIGVELENEFAQLAVDAISVSPDVLNQIIDSRISNHIAFVDSLPDDKRQKCYDNIAHGFKVKTRQETAIDISRVASVDCCGNVITCKYE